MNFLMVVLLISQITTCLVNADRLRRFVGGQSADYGQFPYVVSLRLVESGYHFCGGSIIAEKFILTAAHCLADKHRNDFYVAAGTIFVDTWKKRYFVERFATHVHYDADIIINDIALIKLKTNIKFSRYIQKIPLDISEPPIGVDMTISGWGSKRIEDDNSPTLQYANVTSISLKQCRRRIKMIEDNPNINQKHICTYSEPDLGFCDGDSGGPLVYDGTQVGIVSWAISCAYGYPDVYVKVSSYRTWIKNTKKKLNRMSLII